MGHRRVLLGLLLAASTGASFAACQTPTSMTVAVSTDVLCQELESKSDAAIIVGRAAEDLLDRENVASTKPCVEAGAIGEVVLLPQGDEASEVAFKLVLGVGRDTRDCGVEDPAVPGGPWGACIVARRRLAFLDGEALVVEVPLYERCIGVTCSDGEGDSPFTTCNSKGECVPADLDPEDCLTGCGEEQLQGTVTNAAATASATGAGGDGGASSTADTTSTGGGSTGEAGGGGGGGGGGGPGCTEGSECLLDGATAGVCDADGACVACLDATDCDLTPSQDVCADALCSAGVCGVELVAASEPCAGVPGVCDGSGTCVECVFASDCASVDEECVDGFCQPQSCSDGALNGDETDVDCGGDACAPCANGLACGSAGNPALPENESCLSGSCQPDPDGGGGLACASCATDGQCGVGQFCDVQTGTCEEPLPDGDTCLSDSGCASGVCSPDGAGGAGVCCAEVCNGACESCRSADTGEPSGVCAPVVAGVTCGSPTCENNAVVEYVCGGNGTCAGSATPCSSGQVCVDAACVPDGSGVGGGGDGGASTTSTTTLTGVGGADGAGGGIIPSASAGPSLSCDTEAECDAIDPACFCSSGTCLCPQLPDEGGP